MNEDGEYENNFELTYEGEPLNLNESAAWIADTREVQEDLEVGKFFSSTHVIVMNDNQAKINPLFRHHLFATKKNFESLEILEGTPRVSRTNVTFCPSIDVS